MLIYPLIIDAVHESDAAVSQTKVSDDASFSPPFRLVPTPLPSGTRKRLGWQYDFA